ncbi:MAG: PqqD family protein [Abditibacteriales bacterium]|nr:PqqD family protein [Abditibacteriales bacterium]MDW8364366.1 PqqD family protein [Abditibacteriales bacterium]
MLPEARKDKLLVQDVGDELVVYDQERHRAHRLNRTAAFVWRHCDSQKTAAEVAALLESELNVPANEELVWWTLNRLDKARLLQEPLAQPAEAASISRRQVVRKLGLVGGLALLLPVVTSIVAPTPAMAASGRSQFAQPPEMPDQGPAIGGGFAIGSSNIGR